MTRNSVLLPLIAFLLVTSLWLTLRGFQAPPSKPAVIEAERPRYHLEGAEWLRYDADGEPLFTVAAASVDYFDDASMQMQQVEVQQLGGEQGAWQLTADRGSVPSGQQRLQLVPAVNIVGLPPQHDQVTIRTPELWIDFASEEITTDAEIEARSPGRKLNALGLRADWAGQRVQFLNQVEVIRDAS